MKKIFGALCLAIVLIPVDSERVWAQLFSSYIISNSDEVGWSSNGESQVAQAIPEPENAPTVNSASLPDFESRFAKGRYQFGLNLGYGLSINIPPVDSVSDERTKLRFAHIFPNFKYNLTGLMGKSIYRGALYWVIEAGVALTLQDPKRNNRVVEQAPTYVIGLVPVGLEYKFVNPRRSWAPFLFGGLGGSWGDWFQESKELATAFEFILQAGGGIEYFFANGTAMNLNYRFWHMSNSNIKSPNIGINAHVLSLGYSF